MAGGPAYLLLRPVAPVRPVSAFKTRMRILSPLSKSIWKLSVSPQSPRENPLFAHKTLEQSDRVRRPQTKVQADFVKTGAEAVVANIVGKVVDFIANEGKLLIEVLDDLKWIKKELEYMQCFLEDADSKQITDKKVGKLVAEIRDVSYEVEDVIDTFNYSQQRRRELTKNVKRNIIKPITDYEVAKQMEVIKQKIRDISRRRETYGITDINEGRQEASLQKSRRFSALLEDPEVVGLKEEIEEVRKLLIYEEPRRCVVSIFGMGGSGKTTLAKKVCHAVKDDFDCHAFICISQQYEIRDVLMHIIKCVMGTSFEVIEKLDELELGKKLRDHLEERRYLVVIDDVWSMKVWDTLKIVLPNRMEKSRVILTTRKREVALHAAGTSSHLHEKRLLNPNEEWELFLKTVFQVENAACPSELQEIGEKILAKCKGLPLAILVLGSLPSIKEKTFNAWSNVLKRVHRHLIENPEDCMGILALSYWDLPPHLRPCFLYFGLFPEDYKIDSEKLIRLWIAEGFIQQKGNEIMEDTAQDYLEKLVDRSMIQASSRRSNGSIAKCGIHDLFRDLSISKAEQNNFFTIHNVEGTHSLPNNIRRLALHRSVNGYHPTSTLRSILDFCGAIDISGSEFRQAKFLRVMSQDCRHPRKAGLIKDLKEFVHLRYLELFVASIESLPSPSLGDLDNLQTLVLKQFYGSLSNAISNLKQLRHLDSPCSKVGNLRVKDLTNLQTLSLESGNWIKDGFGNLTNLRDLSITGTPSLNDETLSGSIEKLRSLRSLTLSGLHLPQLMPFTNHFRLYEMSLYGRMEKLPELPPYLTELTLYDSGLEQDDISKLEKLPRLKILYLRDGSYKSEKMICSSRGFPQLEILELSLIPLEEWIIEEGAMPSLKSVKLKYVQLNTQTLPERVRDLLKPI